MIGTILRISALNLLRDRVALALTFALPVAFFSVFALVFGAMDERGADPPDVVVLSEDAGPLASRLVAALRESDALDAADAPAGLTREDAARLVRRGRAAVAVVIPDGFGAGLYGVGGAPPVELLADGSQPLAAALVAGVLQAAALDAGRSLAAPGAPGARPASSAVRHGVAGLPIETSDVVGGRGKRPSIAFFAAGIGVLFLLFAVSGRSAILIEERETGVLTRLLAARVGMGRLLAGRWLFLTALGTAQVSVMFVWASLAFGLDLWTPRHLAGFALLTPVTAAAAAAFGLVLSCACRTRAQLGGVATVVILVLSAVGGSLFPRFLMPESLQQAGRLAFNAWALDGYQKVFWYEAAPRELLVELAVLAAFAAAFLAAARLLARRMERAGA